MRSVTLYHSLSPYLNTAAPVFTNTRPISAQLTWVCKYWAVPCNLIEEILHIPDRHTHRVDTRLYDNSFHRNHIRHLLCKQQPEFLQSTRPADLPSTVLRCCRRQEIVAFLCFWWSRLFATKLRFLPLLSIHSLRLKASMLKHTFSVKVGGWVGKCVCVWTLCLALQAALFIHVAPSIPTTSLQLDCLGLPLPMGQCFLTELAQTNQC